MSDRRFKDKAALDPSAVLALPDAHPSMTGNRTLFPSTVVEPDGSAGILVSGLNNRKLGSVVEKGAFKGYALYSLTLEERATCPLDCAERAVCYGNGMQFARRNAIDPEGRFFALMEAEIVRLLAAPLRGLMVRLHVLGDFPSVPYVAFWAEMLDRHPRLACYGYTHRRTRNWGGDGIGDAIQALKDRHPDRFRIRWSSPAPRPDGAVVISHVPDRPRVDEGLVCPAQTEATGCCATCGLCWENGFRNETIVFVKHGRKTMEAAAEAEMAHARGDAAKLRRPQAATRRSRNAPLTGSDPADTRPVRPIALPAGLKPAEVSADPPEPRLVDPTSLRVEQRYQRDLTGKSISLIRRIVENWNWAKFKAPIVVETALGLLVIDGQHTAIAAATHPAIARIPVMVVAAASIAERAGAFVAHNRDRLAMSPFQVFHGELVAGDPEACGIMDVVAAAGASIPRNPVGRNVARPGQIVPLNQIRVIYRTDGPEVLGEILTVAVKAKLTPISRTTLRAIRMILREPKFADAKAKGVDAIAAAVAGIPNIDLAAETFAVASGQNRDRACAVLIENALLSAPVAPLRNRRLTPA